jgi:ABC-type multidrug transport system fused ATPase/permease subunit
LTNDASNSKHTKQSTFILLRGIWIHLSQKRRIQLSLLLLVMLASGGAELLSLGAVLPFLAVLSDPERLWQQPLFQDVASRAGFTAASQLIIPFTLVFGAAAVMAAVIRLANLWLSGRLAAAVGSDLSCEAYRRTLYQPYIVHIQRNSAAVITGTTTQLARTVVALTSFLQLLTAAVVVAGLLVGLLLINWRVALIAAALFGGVYSLLAVIVRQKLLLNGQMMAAAAKNQIKALNEGLGAIRDVLLDGNQWSYLEIYREADIPQRHLQADNQFFSTFPRYAVEALGLLAMAFLGGFLVHQQGPGGSAIPLLGGIALGAQRLLPALQLLYVSWSNLKGFNADVSAVLALLDQPLPLEIKAINPLSLRESICLEEVCFHYLPGQTNILEGLNLKIHRGDRIGLIGTTGSGKSTMADLIMGLLVPTSGRVLVDGLDLHDPAHPDRLVAWRSAIAHVPQAIYIADGSIAENIAFGVPHRQIDLARVKQAAEQAQIASFIETTLGGYNSIVGERGIRLSGGQRQRLGIARAIYKQAQVLVFDEATSALDTATEEAVIRAVESLSQDYTIVMIAHRLSTLRQCNRVIKLDHGAIAR